MATPTPTNGTNLKLTITATPTTVPELKSITPPAIEQGRIDTTHLESTAREYELLSLPDRQEWSFRIQWDPSNAVHAQLWTIANNKSASEVWLITWADSGAATLAITGGVTKWEWETHEIDGVVMVNITVAATGSLTLTP